MGQWRKTAIAFMIAYCLYFLLDFFVLAAHYDSDASSGKALFFALGVVMLIVLYRIIRNSRRFG